MGDPRRLRNKFTRPKRLWDQDRLKTDKGLRTEFGLRNSSEIWKMAEELKKYRQEARRLLSLSEEERKEDVEKILNKLVKLGIMKSGGSLDDVLSLSVRDFLERRLQTRVFRKGLAKTMKQSRQLITHGFILVDSRKVSIPSFVVSAEQEATISYAKPIDLAAGDLKVEKEAPKAVPSPAPAKVEAKTEEAKGGMNG